MACSPLRFFQRRVVIFGDVFFPCSKVLQLIDQVRPLPVCSFPRSESLPGPPPQSSIFFFPLFSWGMVLVQEGIEPPRPFFISNRRPCVLPDAFFCCALLSVFCEGYHIGLPRLPVFCNLFFPRGKPRVALSPGSCSRFFGHLGSAFYPHP